MSFWLNFGHELQRQRPILLMWSAVSFAVGIGIYFAVRYEPGIGLIAIVAALAVSGVLAMIRLPPQFTLIFAVTVMILLGYLNISLRSHRVAEPVLGFHYYGAVEGRIVAIDRSAKNRPRIMLDQVVLEKTAPARTPKYVRISLHYPEAFVAPRPGQRVMLTASLSPPSSPAEPGGFDFQRFAWFRALGAVGYTRTPMLEFAPPDTSSPAIRLFTTRMALADGIRQRIPGQAGAFSAAILTGDRSAIDPAHLADLRASNLAHLLAISGLHMGLLTGFIFGGIRFVLALSPKYALRLPVKKIAAVGALLAALAYLALSGASVATQRAFVMVAVMLLAIMLNRRALTLRAVAVAALIVLLVRPESLVEAGFQMSFAATTALVAAFGFLRDKGWLVPRGPRYLWLLRPFLAVLLSSAIAGAATAPFSAYHFNQLSQYGLLANLASVPVMGLVVMPAAVIGGLLSPIGLDAAAFFVMGLGVDWILFVAHWVSVLDGSVIRIAKPDRSVLPLISLGFLFLVLWRGKFRTAGLLPIIAAFVIWNTDHRPEILISSNGRLIGVLTPDGRSLNRAKGNGFVAQSWLENDGDGSDQAGAAQKAETWATVSGNTGALDAASVTYIWDKSPDIKNITTACKTYALVVIPNWSGSIGDCHMLTKADFRKLGSIAISGSGDTVSITSAKQLVGDRLWAR